MNTNRYLELRSEAIIGQLECELIEQEDYFVFRTPANPTYHYGNLLCLKVPLNSYSKTQWQQHFSSAFHDMPLVEHYTFCWPRALETEQVKNDFIDHGFSYEEVHVLSLLRKSFETPQEQNTEVTLRPLTTDNDWQQWLELSLAEQQGDYDQTSLRHFLTARMANYQALDHGGQGQYLGAFNADQLIGYAGLYHKNELARFQNVHVISKYQNQKIAKTLLSKLIAQAPAEVTTFVIVADEHYHATKLYQGLGFKVTERNCSVSWWPESQRVQDEEQA